MTFGTYNLLFKYAAADDGTLSKSSSTDLCIAAAGLLEAGVEAIE